MKKLTGYEAIITDLDGTLYYLRPVRIAMLKEMLLHFWRLRDLLVVKKYRELYAQGLSEKERLAQLPPKAPQVIREWMVQRPLRYVCRYRDGILLRWLEKASAAGVPIIVYSDYPVKEKLAALSFAPNLAYSADDLGCLKPDAAGILRVLAQQSIAPEKCLVIGDRAEKDGVLAANMGAEYSFLPCNKQKRKETYQEILM